VTAGLLSPISADARIRDEKRSELDRLYHTMANFWTRDSRVAR
jgi:hypothetical protein